MEARSTTDHIGNTQFSSFIPDSRTDQTLSAFAQDRIALKPDRFYVTLGTKIEHNDYTGIEHQPSHVGRLRQRLLDAHIDIAAIMALGAGKKHLDRVGIRC